MSTATGDYAGRHKHARTNLRQKVAVRLLRFLLRKSPAAEALAHMSDDEVIAAVQDDRR